MWEEGSCSEKSRIMLQRVTAFSVQRKLTRKCLVTFCQAVRGRLWDTLKLQLIVLQVDVNIPVGTLYNADRQICSEHFKHDDWCPSKKSVRASVPEGKCSSKSARTNCWVAEISFASCSSLSYFHLGGVLQQTQAQIKSDEPQIQMPHEFLSS